MWGKYLKKYLSADIFELYTKTYSNYEKLWTAIFAACELFRDVAIEVGRKFGFVYNQSDDDNMMEYLIKMKNNKYFIQ
jgi:aminoglycoside 6-adenylyltransferase